MIYSSRIHNYEYAPIFIGYGGVFLKRVLSVVLILMILTGTAGAVDVLEEEAITIAAPYAVLMEQSTGTLLYEKQSHVHCSPASVTKIMTMLLVMEAMENGVIAPDTMVTASERAASMGGSQIWLEQGEWMSVDEMLKCVAVVSANDCAVALAEQIAGTEEAFVRQMNQRAKELGMVDTNFTNCTGLREDEDHYTSAYDIALMSRELLCHEEIKKYTTIWMDTIRNGEFGLSNTNKLIYYYDGATGLKTGFTTKAMYCLSASAERDGVEYIAVILHADTSSDRFESAKTLLSYAFANYERASLRPAEALPPVKVLLGTVDSVQPVYLGDEYKLTGKGSGENFTFDIQMVESVTAPVEEGQSLGTLLVQSGDEKIIEVEIVASTSVARLTFLNLCSQLIYVLLGLNM